MQLPFTYLEGAILVRMLAAHIISDFLLQTNRSIKSKNTNTFKSAAFWWHGVLTFVILGIFLANYFNIVLVTLITLSHLVIDYVKLYFTNKPETPKWKHKNLWLFITDQLLHIIILILGWLNLINGFTKIMELGSSFINTYPIMLRILGYLVVIGPITYLIKFLTQRWATDIEDENNSLNDAGKWIGILERVLVLTLIFVNQFTAIGFIITAKSILRLIDKPDAPFIKTGVNKSFSARKHTEYVLVGTFLSVGSAFVIGLIINWLLALQT
jgi:hypothetical protein